MKKLYSVFAAILLAVSLCALAAPASAQPREGSRAEAARVRTPLNLAVLVQDDLVARVGNELKVTSDFIRSLPAGSRVMVGYIRTGALQVRQPFTSDLGAAARALIRLPQAWDPPLGKLRTPQDYVFAACRALGVPAAERGPDVALGGLGALGQPLWTAPQPDGWADIAAEWAAPEAMMRRLDWAFTIAGRYGEAEQRDIAEAALGPLARAETVSAMGRAGSRRDALTLLLASPEFMRR